MFFSSPHNLIMNPESLFHTLCQNSDEYDTLKSLALKLKNKDDSYN
jgi:hypothetical protein